jgi:rhodanese-related sulfurtransferase
MEAHKLVQAGKAILIDVREEHEVRESGVAEGAQWMPMSKMDEDEPEWAAFKAALPKDKTIFLYCAVGGRSGRVAEFLAQDGYTTENIGGFKDWKAAGLPVKKI